MGRKMNQTGSGGTLQDPLMGRYYYFIFTSSRYQTSWASSSSPPFPPSVHLSWRGLFLTEAFSAKLELAVVVMQTSFNRSGESAQTICGTGSSVRLSVLVYVRLSI